MSDFRMHEKRNSPWSVVLGIRLCLTEISAGEKSSGLLFCLTGTSANRYGNQHDLQFSGYLELRFVAVLCYAVQRLIEFPLCGQERLPPQIKR